MSIEGLKPTNPKDAIGSNKIPLHLWPQTATIYGSMALLSGALKYGRANWRSTSVRASIYVDALSRHLGNWFEGQDADEETGLSHLAHVLACAAILVDALESGTLKDDRQFCTISPGTMRKLTDDVARLKKQYESLNPRHFDIQDSKRVTQNQG